jgi:hypothetical protein
MQHEHTEGCALPSAMTNIWRPYKATPPSLDAQHLVPEPLRQLDWIKAGHNACMHLGLTTWLTQMLQCN